MKNMICKFSGKELELRDFKYSSTWKFDFANFKIIRKRSYKTLVSGYSVSVDAVDGGISILGLDGEMSKILLDFFMEHKNYRPEKDYVRVYIRPKTYSIQLAYVKSTSAGIYGGSGTIATDEYTKGNWQELFLLKESMIELSAYLDFLQQK